MNVLCKFSLKKEKSIIKSRGLVFLKNVTLANAHFLSNEMNRCCFNLSWLTAIAKTPSNMSTAPAPTVAVPAMMGVVTTQSPHLDSAVHEC